MKPVLAVGDEPFTLCVAALCVARAGRPCVVRRTSAPPGASGLRPWPSALLADAGFRRFAAAELGLGWPPTGRVALDLDDAVGLEDRFAHSVDAFSGRIRSIPNDVVPVRRGHTGTYDATPRRTPQGAQGPPCAWSAILGRLVDLDFPVGSVFEASSLVLAGFAGDMVDEGWWSPGDPHLFGAMTGRSPRVTRRDDIEAGVADVRTLSRALPAWLGRATKKSSPSFEKVLDGVSGLHRSGA